MCIRDRYGLKSSPARFHEHLSLTLSKLGFKPSKADPDLWLKLETDHYEYIARYVDDVIVFSKDPIKIIEDLKNIYEMKGVGKPQYYLGGDIVQIGEEWKSENVSMAFSAQTYIENILPKLAGSCDIEQLPKASTPFSETFPAELEKTGFLDPKT